MKQSKQNLLVGITGSIGTGKSTVSSIIKKHGYTVLDADELSRELCQPGSPALSEIRNRFGSEAILNDGTLNRPFLRAKIFSDTKCKLDLEAILHPKIQALSQEKKLECFKRGETIVFYEAPVLFEAKSDQFVDAVICVVADEQQILDRTTSRDLVTREMAQKALSSQMPQEEKIQRSNYIIKNTGSLSELEAETQLTISKIEATLK